MLLCALVDRLPGTTDHEVLRIVTREKYLQDAAGNDRLTLLGENHAFFGDVLVAIRPSPP